MVKISLLLCFVIVAFAAANVSAAKHKVGIYELKKGDLSVKFTNWGATIISLLLPDREGKLADVVLGYDSISGYMNDTVYFGATVGRVANRIGGAQFTLNGTHYKLVANEGKNMLHGGHRGFSDIIWKVREHKKEGRYPHITFTYRSFDGEQGFPGDLLVSVTYMLMGKNRMSVIMKAKALNKATPVNLAHHSYWNLGGHNSGDILSHNVHLFGSKITPVDHELIPTGKIVPVKGTPYDFLEPRTVGSRIKDVPGGYDINYALDGEMGHVKRAIIVHDNKSGRVMELWTNKPGLQFYTSNQLVAVKGKGGFVYKKYAAIVLETQGFPDSVNHPNFPSQIVSPGQVYKHFMLFKFKTK
ncbi:hypothetical protein HHK36_007210 [Tetracentron sinense]|uniref:Aldose 1-epimerase n=1 Tax=Tetracentron sinense TaxID=13715 RepID=A0A834ZIV2_TETSI|nr:hypothetical protein HHK36_007210 [Tetracentron sinense]